MPFAALHWRSRHAIAVGNIGTWRTRQAKNGELDMDKKPAPSGIFPERLRAARKLRDMEQVELAAKAGLPATSISHFEAGARKPSFDNLRRLAQALAVTADYLLGQVDEPETNAAADPLYRDMQKLTEEDRTLAKAFLAMLASRKNQNDEK